MVKSKYANYNKYLRQLASFSGTQLLLEHFVVPTSVVFTWNCISLLLKGAPYDSLDWDGVTGCVMRTGNTTVRREDLNHLIISVAGSSQIGRSSNISNISAFSDTTNLSNVSNASNASMANRISKEGEEVESEVVEGTFIRGYSMRPKPVNEYYIISTPDDSDGAPPMDMPSFGGKMTATQPSVAHLTALVVPTEEELGIRRSAFSPSSRVGSPLTASWVVASPSNRSRAMGGESFSPQASLTKRSHNPRSPSSLSSKAASPRNRSLVSAVQSP